MCFVFHPSTHSYDILLYTPRSFQNSSEKFPACYDD